MGRGSVALVSSLEGPSAAEQLVENDSEREQVAARVDVTPFARPIPLPEGTHYVTLVHPSAPVEKRTVAIVHGETRTIDAVMNMPELGPAEDAAPEEVSADKGGPPKDNQR